MLISAKYLVTGDGKTVLSDQAVVTDERGKIKEFGNAVEMKQKYPQEEVKDYGDATIMPGLCDMHVHLGYWHSQPDGYLYNDKLLSYFAYNHAKTGLLKGITSMRDCSSRSGLCRDMKIAAQKGFITMPNLVHMDRGICMSGGHGWDDDIEQVDSPWGIRSAIRSQLREGAEWIKVLTTHRSHIPEYTQEELDAAVDECHRRGLKCAVHSGTHPSIQMCIDAGFDTIEHGTFMRVEQAQQMAEKGLAWTPTIMAYTLLYDVVSENIKNRKTDTFNDPVAAKEMADYEYFKPAYEAYRDNFKKLYDTGVTVLAGTDMVLYEAPTLPIPRELQYMVEYGITPLQAIQTATQNPAKVLGTSDERGMIKEGLDADILVVDGDVSKDITKLNDVKLVLLAGKKIVDNGVQYI